MIPTIRTIRPRACPACGRVVKAVDSAADGQRAYAIPIDGDPFVCAGCRALLLFDGDDFIPAAREDWLDYSAERRDAVEFLVGGPVRILESANDGT